LLAGLIKSDVGVLIWSGLASAVVVAVNFRSVVSLAGVAVCVSANALMANQHALRRMATRSWERFPDLCGLACWCAAATVLAFSGVLLAEIGLLLGSGLAFTFWNRCAASISCTVGTAVVTLLAVVWLGPVPAVIAGAVGVLVLCLRSVSQAALRSMCVVMCALVLSALLARNWNSQALSVLAVLTSVAAGMALPHMLAAVQQRANGVSTSIPTLAGMSIPSRRDALIAVGAYAVLAAFSVQLVYGIAISALWLSLFAWRRNGDRSTAVEARLPLLAEGRKPFP
jgi:hypothetical protein